MTSRTPAAAFRPARLDPRENEEEEAAVEDSEVAAPDAADAAPAAYQAAVTARPDHGPVRWSMRCFIIARTACPELAE